MIAPHPRSSVHTLFLLFLFLPGIALAKTPQEVFAIASKSVVVVETLDSKSKVTAIGSGVVVATNELLTNCHVVQDGRSWRITTPSGTKHKAILLARLKKRDLCLMYASKLEARPALLGAAFNLDVGAAVYAIGSPEGLELSLSNGVVSQLRGNKNAPLIQTTAPISPGSSGGGLFDSEGRLVGITTFYLEGGQNLNFAMPVEWLAELREPENLVTDQSQTPASPDAPPHTQPKEREPLPELLKVAETDSYTRYLKTSTVSRSSIGFAQAWILDDSNSPTYFPLSGYYYQSQMFLNEYDCDWRRIGMLSVTNYSERMGRGRALESISTAPHKITYKQVTPGTVGESELDTVCEIAKRKR